MTGPGPGLSSAETTHPSIELRSAGPENRDFLCAVYASTRAEELTLTNWPDEQKAAFCLQQFTAQDAYYREHYRTAVFSVILSGGVPVGRLYVDRWTREIRIMDIALLPAYRGIGIGSHLLRTLQEEARGAGKSLSIHVEKFNPALRLYERLGFRPQEDKGVYLLMAWQPPSEESAA